VKISQQWLSIDCSNSLAEIKTTHSTRKTDNNDSKQ